MWCQSVSLLLAIGLSASLTRALPNPTPTTDNDLSSRQIPPDSSCTNTCTSPYSVPVWNQVFDVCGCKQPNPSQCPNQTCDLLYHVEYNSTSEKCTCEFGTGILLPANFTIPPYLIGRQPRETAAPCPDITCGAGNTLDTDSCTCNPMWPLDACPLIKCRGGYHPVYNATSGGCGCSLDCPSLSCAAQFNPFYNSTTRECTCEEMVHGLLPTSESPWAATHTGTVVQGPTATASIGIGPVVLPPAGVAHNCGDIFCISEMQPVWNSTTGGCECEWIPGFGPADE